MVKQYYDYKKLFLKDGAGISFCWCSWYWLLITAVSGYPWTERSWSNAQCVWLVCKSQRIESEGHKHGEVFFTSAMSN